MSTVGDEVESQLWPMDLSIQYSIDCPLGSGDTAYLQLVSLAHYALAFIC
jgi:hypothetical protein